MSTLKKITKWFKNLFVGQNLTTEMDAYIESKNPTNMAEVDYWIKHYDQATMKGTYLWKA